MTDRAICGGRKSVCKTAVCFGDNKETFASGRLTETKGRQSRQPNPHTKDLTRAEMGMVTGGNFEEMLYIHGNSPF